MREIAQPHSADRRPSRRPQPDLVGVTCWALEGVFFVGLALAVLAVAGWSWVVAVSAALGLVAGSLSVREWSRYRAADR